ncbi:hypothetical protein D9M71_798070 [compost metagenome]
MQIAVDNMVPGIDGECGGACSCATCHVYVDPAWQERLPPRSGDETFMLEGASAVGESSRLSCQLKMREEWDGLVLRIPATQGGPQRTACEAIRPTSCRHSYKNKKVSTCWNSTRSHLPV